MMFPLRSPNISFPMGIDLGETVLNLCIDLRNLQITTCLFQGKICKEKWTNDEALAEGIIKFKAKGCCKRLCHTHLTFLDLKKTRTSFWSLSESSQQAMIINTIKNQENINDLKLFLHGKRTCVKFWCFKHGLSQAR